MPRKEAAIHPPAEAKWFYGCFSINATDIIVYFELNAGMLFSSSFLSIFLIPTNIPIE